MRALRKVLSTGLLLLALPCAWAQTNADFKRCEAVGSTTKLVVREGKAHGWPDMGRDMERLADWFDEHLRGLKPKP